uniref:Uncharacterized protein n=1 Tax=Heterorhabditis bacteriophora TaxID=37862 RepID=A0A1I7XTN0_HETBA
MDLKNSKRRADTLVTRSGKKLREVVDIFEKHISRSLEQSCYDQMKLPKRNRIVKKHTFEGLGDVIEYSGIELMNIYIAHAINHLIRTRNLIIGNNHKLTVANENGGASEELIENIRDQGFARPTVLILCPFKKDAFDIVERLKSIVFGKGEKIDVWNKSRFEKEFQSGEAPEFQSNIAEEFKELLTGNNDDCFRVGIALSKKTLKLFEPFEKSDILLCSPLGLRMILDGEVGNDSHLISNGQAKLFSQLLLFSRYSHELFSALMFEYSMNYHGLLVQQVKQCGTLDRIELPLCQELHRFDVENPADHSSLRFKYFTENMMSYLLPHTCIVIPSYFDFVRIRNYLKRNEESFVACHEYAPLNKITRARDLFFHQKKSLLLVTERYHYFNRRHMKSGLSTDWDERDFSEFTCPNELSFPVQNNIDPIHFEITSVNASFDPKTDVVSHKCMSETIKYDDIPPLRGDHRPNWAKYGEYLYLPVQRWMHNLEHGTIVLLYHPCVDQGELSKLREIVTKCLYRHIITPYNKLSDRLVGFYRSKMTLFFNFSIDLILQPLALVAWGAKLEMNQVISQQAIDFIKMHARIAPEDLFKNGLYDRYLIRPAVKVNDDMDNDLCSHYEF